MPSRQLTVEEINRRQLTAEIQFHSSALKCRGNHLKTCKLPGRIRIKRAAVERWGFTSAALTSAAAVISDGSPLWFHLWFGLRRKNPPSSHLTHGYGRNKKLVSIFLTGL